LTVPVGLFDKAENLPYMDACSAKAFADVFFNEQIIWQRCTWKGLKGKRLLFSEDEPQWEKPE